MIPALSLPTPAQSPVIALIQVHLSKALHNGSLPQLREILIRLCLFLLVHNTLVLRSCDMLTTGDHMYNFRWMYIRL